MRPRTTPLTAGTLPAGVPTVDFYGEAATWSTSALVHSEPLIERSRLHEWKIRPHRHDSLAQLFLLLHGTGTARFDAADFELNAPCVAVVPPRCVHEFEWSRDCDGFALSIAAALVTDLKSRLGTHGGAFQEPAVIGADADAEFVAVLARRIEEEYVSDRPMKEMALASLIGSLAIWVARATAPTRKPDRNASRASRHYQRFVELVETQHRAQWSVADYARELGITAPHLNAICRRLHGDTALRVIHDRVLLAARRELAYTDKSIAGVATGLGFAEPTYFTRFFRRYMGITPKAYRRRSGTLSGL